MFSSLTKHVELTFKVSTSQLGQIQQRQVKVTAFILRFNNYQK